MKKMSYLALEHLQLAFLNFPYIVLFASRQSILEKWQQIAATLCHFKIHKYKVGKHNNFRAKNVCW